MLYHDSDERIDSICNQSIKAVQKKQLDFFEKDLIVLTREDKVSVITQIGLDHIDILGNSLKEITTEKVAIIHKNNIVISIKY